MNLNDQSDLTSLVNRENAVLVYFYNDDCAPCVNLRPKIEHLMVRFFPRMKMMFIDAKNDRKTPASFGVFANPTILLFFEGKEFLRFSKYISLEELESSIRKYYSLLFDEE